MPGSDIEAFIEELEDLINNAKSPLSGGGSKKIIDADAAYEILDDIKRSLPDEFQKARRILRERDEILDSAEEEANHIVKDAEDKANTLASEQEVVRLANNVAEDVRRHAEEEAREIRYWAENAAEQTFAKLEDELRAVIEKTTGMLNQMSYCRALLAGKTDDEDEQDDMDQRYVQ